MASGPHSGTGLQAIERPNGEVRIVRAEDARVEEYRVILPRQDGRGWRTGRVRGPEGRRELVSPELCGARGIHVSVVTLPRGVRDEPHWHVSGEKVMYVTAGRGRIHCGSELEKSYEVGPGDCVYVPPFAVHAPESDENEELEFVMVSNAPMDVTVPG